MATTDTKTVRFTKAMRYTDLAAFIEGNTMPNGSSKSDLLDFINHEIQLLDKKNTSGNKKLTPTQEANIQYREAIYNFLCTQADPLTCTEIQANVPELADFNNQKVAALVKRLCDDQRVIKSVNKKGRSVFSVA